MKQPWMTLCAALTLIVVVCSSIPAPAQHGRGGARPKPAPAPKPQRPAQPKGGMGKRAPAPKAQQPKKALGTPRKNGGQPKAKQPHVNKKQQNPQAGSNGPDASDSESASPGEPAQASGSATADLKKPEQPSGSATADAKKSEATKSSGSAKTDAKKYEQTDLTKRTERGDEKKKAREEAIAKKEHRESERAREEKKKRAEARKKGLPLADDQGIISRLHSAHSRLAEADHDYGGHRVRSMEHISGALHHLGASSPGTMAGRGAGRLAQVESDRILREGLSHLEHAERELAAKSRGASHHPPAREAVGHAIRELREALRVR